MYKNYFHNKKTVNKIKKKIFQTHQADKKKVVDINILLNRVKLEGKDRFKKKLFFFSILTLVMGIFITLIV